MSNNNGAKNLYKKKAIFGDAIYTPDRRYRKLHHDHWSTCRLRANKHEHRFASGYVMFEHTAAGRSAAALSRSSSSWASIYSGVGSSIASRYQETKLLMLTCDHPLVILDTESSEVLQKALYPLTFTFPTAKKPAPNSKGSPNVTPFWQVCVLTLCAC